MTTVAETPLPSDRGVRVWFGEHIIAEYTAEPETALRYQAAMTRRFASLRVTIEPAGAVVPDADLS
jgi:hypothetical protein